jgi:hypothetical protein
LDAIIEAGGGLADGQSRFELRTWLENQVSTARILGNIRKWRHARPAHSDEFEKISRAASRLLVLLGVKPDGEALVAPGLYDGLVQQGRAWANEWSLADKKVQETDQGKRLLKHHRLHGNWPTETSFLTYMTSDGEATYYGEDLALVRAIEGLQRIRTWAEIAARAPGATKVAKKQAIRKFPENRKPATILIWLLALRYPLFFGQSFGISKPPLPTADGRAAGEVSGRCISYIQACLRPLRLGKDMSGEAIEKAWDTCRKDAEPYGK